MKKIRITVMRIASYPELMAQYENPMTDACRMQVGQYFMPRAGRSRRGSVRARGIRCRRSCWRWRTAGRIFTTAG